MFGFVAKHRGIWPVSWMCEALGVSRSGFFAWLSRPPCARVKSDEAIGRTVRASFLQSDRTYGARRVWRDVLSDGFSCGLHRIERLMRVQALRARPRRRRLPSDTGELIISAVAPNALDRHFEASAPNKKWVADFTYIWTAEGWLYVAGVIDLYSRRVVGWSMSALRRPLRVPRPKREITAFTSDRGSVVAGGWIGCRRARPAARGSIARGGGRRPGEG
jgi:putative transposase